MSALSFLPIGINTSADKTALGLYTYNPFGFSCKTMSLGITSYLLNALTGDFNKSVIRRSIMACTSFSLKFSYIIVGRIATRNCPSALQSDIDIRLNRISVIKTKIFLIRRNSSQN